MKVKNLFKENGIFSGKRVLALVIAATFFSGTALGVTASSYTFGSMGNVVYDQGETKKVVFNKDDLVYLDNKIDTAIAATNTAKTEATTGKINIAKELNGWVNESYSKNYTATSSLSENPDEPPTYGDIIAKLGYMKSTPGTGKEFKDSGNNQYYVNAGGGLTTEPTEAADSTKKLTISPAQASNLSAGTAAWVNGSFIIGTGADNNYYYNQGYPLGYSNGRTQGQNDVKSSPNDYNLYSKTQYDANYTSGYNAGKTNGAGTNIGSVAGSSSGNVLLKAGTYSVTYIAHVYGYLGTGAYISNVSNGTTICGWNLNKDQASEDERTIRTTTFRLYSDTVCKATSSGLGSFGCFSAIMAVRTGD